MMQPPSTETHTQTNSKPTPPTHTHYTLRLLRAQRWQRRLWQYKSSRAHKKEGKGRSRVPFDLATVNVFFFLSVCRCLGVCLYDRRFCASTASWRRNCVCGKFVVSFCTVPAHGKHTARESEREGDRRRKKHIVTTSGLTAIGIIKSGRAHIIM